MSSAEVTVFICISCKGTDANTEQPGRLLYDAVTAGLLAREDRGVTVKPVECLGVCKRPCTVALVESGKWTYVIGDLDHVGHADDVIAAALSFGATENGIIPWRERPQSFRKGLVARIPPPGFCAEGEAP